MKTKRVRFDDVYFSTLSQYVTYTHKIHDILIHCWTVSLKHKHLSIVQFLPSLIHLITASLFFLLVTVDNSDTELTKIIYYKNFHK